MRMPEFKNMVHCIDSGMPINFFQVAHAKKDAKDFKLGRRPIQTNGRIRTTTPTT